MEEDLHQVLLLGSTVLDEAGHFLLLDREDSLKDDIAGGDCEVTSVLELTDVPGVRIVSLSLSMVLLLARARWSGGLRGYGIKRKSHSKYECFVISLLN